VQVPEGRSSWTGQQHPHVNTYTPQTLTEHTLMYAAMPACSGMLRFRHIGKTQSPLLLRLGLNFKLEK
jgi:hypothetical protein